MKEPVGNERRLLPIRYNHLPDLRELDGKVREQHQLSAAPLLLSSGYLLLSAGQFASAEVDNSRANHTFWILYLLK